jgi:hypothetical protein
MRPRSQFRRYKKKQARRREECAKWRNWLKLLLPRRLISQRVRLKTLK